MSATSPLCADRGSEDLLKVAGMPVLKRALPVIAAVAAVLFIGLRRKVRRRSRSAR